MRGNKANSGLGEGGREREQVRDREREEEQRNCKIGERNGVNFLKLRRIWSSGYSISTLRNCLGVPIIAERIFWSPICNIVHKCETVNNEECNE